MDYSMLWLVYLHQLCKAFKWYTKEHATYLSSGIFRGIPQESFANYFILFHVIENTWPYTISAVHDGKVW